MTDVLQQKISEFRQNNIKLTKERDVFVSLINNIYKYFDALEDHELFVVKLKHGENIDIKTAIDWYRLNVGQVPVLGANYAVFMFTDKAQAALFKTFFY